MRRERIIANDRALAPLGSLEGSTAYLERQTWWQLFREGRYGCVPLMDDVLWVGHFCAWLRRRGLAPERCTKSDAEAYFTSIASFRPGPRMACERAVTGFVDFLAAEWPPAGSPPTATKRGIRRIEGRRAGRC